MRFSRRALLASASALLTALLARPLPAEPPAVNYLLPCGGQRGSTVELTANGKFAHWPPQVASAASGLTWKPGSEAGKWQVEIAADAQPGLTWVRFHDEEGASRWTPFFVGQVSEVLEVEPNDRATEAMPLSGPAVIHGKLAKSGDLDSFAVQLQAGETLVASVTARETLGAPMDAILQIAWVRDVPAATGDAASAVASDPPDVFVVAHDDDERGLDPQLTYQAQRDGTHLVRIFAFPSDPNSTIGFAGGDNYVYRLTVTKGPFLDHTLPLAVQRGVAAEVQAEGWNLAAPVCAVPAVAEGERVVVHLPDTVGTATLQVVDAPVVLAAGGAEPQAISVPAAISGRLESGQPRHRFSFAATKGQEWQISVASQSLGFPCDMVLRVVDAAGKTVAEADDRKGDRDAELNWKPADDGTYELQVLDRYASGGPRHAYLLTINPAAAPDYRLSVAKDAYVLAGDKPLEIAVGIDRQRGFAGEVTLTVEGLPEGIVAEPVVSKNEGPAAKEVKLSLRVTEALAQPFQGSVRITGRDAEGDLVRVARATDAPAQSPADQIWLTTRK